MRMPWSSASGQSPACDGYAVLPAAGHSRRMGRPKLLLPWGSGRLIEHVLRQYLAAPLQAVVVVVRPEDEPLAQCVQATGALVCRPPQAPREMKESVQWGLRFLEERFSPRAEDVWLLSPCDVPGVSPELIARLLGYYRPECPEVIVPEHRRRSGHPVALPWRAAAEVFALGPRQGINVVVRRWPQCRVPVDSAGVLRDVDTPDAYAALRPGGFPSR